MAVTHSEQARNALAQAIADMVENGTGTAKLQVLTSGDVLLVEWALPSPAFSPPAAGVIDLQGTPTAATAVGTGTAAKFRLLSRAGDLVLEGSVGTAGDLSIDNTSIAAGQSVTLSAFAYAAAP